MAISNSYVKLPEGKINSPRFDPGGPTGLEVRVPVGEVWPPDELDFRRKLEF